MLTASFEKRYVTVFLPFQSSNLINCDKQVILKVRPIEIIYNIIQILQGLLTQNYI